MKQQYFWSSNLARFVVTFFLPMIFFAHLDYAQGEASATATGKQRGPGAIVDDPVASQPVSSPPKSNDNKALRFQVSYVYRAGGEGAMKTLKSGATLHSGDHYKIQFTSEQDAYVYIFQIDSSGAVYQLYPMRDFKGVVVNSSNPVKAGVSYYVPSAHQSFELDRQTGTEKLYFLAFAQSNPTFETIAEQLWNAQKTNNALLATATATDFAGEVNLRGPVKIVADPAKRVQVSWSANEIFEMPLQRLDDLCATCVNTIEFIHK